MIPGSPDTDVRHDPRGSALGLAQLIAILLQFAGLIWLGGRWSAEMSATGERVKELQSILTDITKAQAQGAIVDATQSQRLEVVQRRLDEITIRIERLEKSDRDPPTKGVGR